MIKKSLVMATMSLLLGGLAACDVDKTKEGSVSVPKYDIDKTQQGNVTLPNYDVKTPDVAVKKEEKQVQVPTIETEKRTIDVPKVDIKPANEK